MTYPGKIVPFVCPGCAIDLGLKFPYSILKKRICFTVKTLREVMLCIIGSFIVAQHGIFGKFTWETGCLCIGWFPFLGLRNWCGSSFAGFGFPSSQKFRPVLGQGTAIKGQHLGRTKPVFQWKIIIYCHLQFRNLLCLIWK